MHDIEPYFKWRTNYIAAKDNRSPFYGRTYSEFQYSQKIYNYFIHPQWDHIGSPTLYIKILFVDYEEQFAIFELFGEWNDATTNDIMYLKREIIDEMTRYDIHKYVLICDNVLNFHGDGDDYYEEWYQDVADEEGWIAIVNILDHVEEEMKETNIHHYANLGGFFNGINWRGQKPKTVFIEIMEGKDSNKPHRSGFVNIIGRPNVGKSTLLNALVGERMSIITNKPQTTRHRIIGIVSEDDYQVVFSDTPGVIENPAYKMQEVMNSFVSSTFQDADVMIFLMDANESYAEEHAFVERIKKLEVPVFLVVNKIDTIDDTKLLGILKDWSERIDFAEIIPISALNKKGTDALMRNIVKYLPEGPVYYPKDQFTDRSERFLVSEIIREKILEQYHQEIPYSAEVIINSFKEGKTTKGDDIVRMEANIFVERDTQKSIIIGKKGVSIKRLGTEARKSIEKFLGCKVHLELHVKVKGNWRDNDQELKRFGY